MNGRQALASALHLFVLFLFVAAGFLSVSLYYLADARAGVMDFLLHDTEKWLQIGFGLLVTALILFIGFYVLNRGRTLRIKMGTFLTDIDPEIVAATLDACFKTQFPKKISLKEVGIANGTHLEIQVALCPLDEGEREELFIRAERELQTLLKEKFGYAKPFYFIIKL